MSREKKYQHFVTVGGIPRVVRPHPHPHSQLTEEDQELERQRREKLRNKRLLELFGSETGERTDRQLPM